MCVNVCIHSEPNHGHLGRSKHSELTAVYQHFAPKWLQRRNLDETKAAVASERRSKAAESSAALLQDPSKPTCSPRLLGQSPLGLVRGRGSEVGATEYSVNTYNH